MLITKEGKEYTVEDGNEWFWRMFEDGSWEPHTFKIFDKFLSGGTRYLDIGAWIGPTVLYVASKCHEVYAFEPDKVAFDTLLKNIELNNLKHVHAKNIAVSDDWKNIKIGVRNQQGDSMSSILWDRESIEVSTIPFGTLLVDISPGFIKMDIEGGEVVALKDSMYLLNDIRPTLYLSLHSPWFVGEEKEKYNNVIKLALGHYPTILDENLEKTTVEEMLNRPGFVSLVATYEV